MEQMSIEMQKLVEDQESKYHVYETDVGSLHEENIKLQNSLNLQMQNNAALCEELEKMENIIQALGNQKNESITRPIYNTNTDKKETIQQERLEVKKKSVFQAPSIVHKRSKTKYLPVLEDLHSRLSPPLLPVLHSIWVFWSD